MQKVQHSTTNSSATQADESLRRVVADQIGPRRPGVIYSNVDGAFRVLDLITDPSEARRILKRRSAQFAVIVIDTLRPDAEPFPVGSVWTGSDRVLKAVA
jgi:hypothetical protein